MKNNSKQLKHILERLPKARTYFASQPPVIFAYVFGSFAKGRTTSFSDIDIAVYVKSTKDLSIIKTHLISDLIDILETDNLDLVILNTASLFLKAQVIKQKKIIIDKQPFVRHKFESLTLREYFDFSVKERDILKRRYSIG